MKDSALMPVLYIPHGGGPLPLLGDENHRDLVSFLERISSTLVHPAAILIISAHWEAKTATITGGVRPPMIYDYYGFPPEAYEIEYTAPGEPNVAKRISELLTSAGIPAKVDEDRGFDHGLYVPLMLMYPQATIPCIQVSLFSSLDPAEHIALGKALSPLRREGVMIIGSGMSFHNLSVFFSERSKEVLEVSKQFDRWLVETCSSVSMETSEREDRLVHWEKAPHARFCHPREEHLLPLHVCFGAASATTQHAEVEYSDELMGAQVTAFLW